MKTMKKVTSLLLCLVMLCCMAVPISAEEKLEKKAPIILVNDIKDIPLYDATDKQVYPLSYDTEELKNKITKTMPAFLYGVSSGDYKSWISEFKGIINELYAPLVLNKNGDSTNGTHCNFTYNRSNVEKNGDDYYDYSFMYDWRLSPKKVIGYLKDYIDAIIDSSKCSKVSLVGNGYGATVILAYLSFYGTESRLESVVLNSSVARGTEAMDALFTGDIKVNPSAMLNYFDNGNTVFGDEALTEILISLFSALNTVNLLGKPSNSIEEAISELYAAAAPEILPMMIGGMLPYWTMVSSNKIEKAKKFIFNDEKKKEAYSGFISKIDDYYENIQVNIDSTLTVRVNLGLNFANITKYDYASIPINKNSDLTGDGTVEVNRASFGANAAAFGNVLSKEYIASIDEKYLSTDHIIDASTCLFPNRTWFIKGLHHDENPKALSELIYTICNSGNTMTAMNNAEYPQYLKYSQEKETLSPMIDFPIVVSSVQDTINAISRFAKSIVDFLKKLISKLADVVIPGVPGLLLNVTE